MSNDGLSEDARRWLALPDEEQLKEHSYYKRRYEAAYELFDKPVPKAWEDLTHEERCKVRDECIRYGRAMQSFGESLKLTRPPNS